MNEGSGGRKSLRSDEDRLRRDAIFLVNCWGGVVYFEINSGVGWAGRVAGIGELGADGEFF